MGPRSRKNSRKPDAEDADLRNYVFYADPLSKEDVRRKSEVASIVSSKLGTDIEEGETNNLVPHEQPPRVEASYYTRMALEEAEALENTKSSLHNPHIRVQLAQMKSHRPWFLGLMTLIQVGALIGTLILNWKSTGTPIQTNPMNYMIGPASGSLITMGARFVPCMRLGTGLENYASIECPTGIKGSGSDPAVCTLADICGMGGVDRAKPNQWYRFFTAIGLHGGVVHLMFNMSFQLRTGLQMEKDFGWWRVAAIYMTSGVAGFVFGANFNPLTPSVGCSGSLYGLLACLLLDLFQNWRLISKPWLELLKMLIQICISLMIGMLPYIDNFAHIGGFATGILAGLVFMPTIHFGKWDRMRKRILMGVAFPGLVLVLFFMVRGFYDATATCTWCKYLNCIPGMPWCDQKWSVATVTSSSNT